METPRAQQYQATTDLVELATRLGHSLELSRDPALHARFGKLFQEIASGATQRQSSEQYRLFQQAYLTLQEQLTTLIEVSSEAPREIWRILFEMAVNESRQLEARYQKVAGEWHERYGWPSLGGDLKALIQRGEDVLSGKKAPVVAKPSRRKPGPSPLSLSTSPPVEAVVLIDLAGLSDEALGETIRAHIARSPREYQALADTATEELVKRVRPLLARLDHQEPLLARQYALFRNQLRADGAPLPLINLAFCLGRLTALG